MHDCAPSHTHKLSLTCVKYMQRITITQERKKKQQRQQLKKKIPPRKIKMKTLSFFHHPLPPPLSPPLFLSLCPSILFCFCLRLQIAKSSETLSLETRLTAYWISQSAIFRRIAVRYSEMHFYDILLEHNHPNMQKTESICRNVCVEIVASDCDDIIWYFFIWCQSHFLLENKN